MSDAADNSDNEMQTHLSSSQNAIRYRAQNMPKGKSGDCDLCGEWSGRLVQGNCASCRDKYKLD